MKRILVITMLLWNIFASHAQQPDWANKTRYEAANERLQHVSDSLRVVMMGNSITEYWEELHPEFFTAHGLVGRGISGQVSSQMLSRFRQDVINLHPRVVVINCGTNDIAENNGPYDEDITMDNIMSMTELAQTHGIDVILSSVLPTDSFIWNPHVKNVSAKVVQLNRRIMGYCEANNIPYLDYYSSMVGSRGTAMDAGYTDDGVHPNSTGYDVMEVKLLDMLDQLSNINYNNQ